MDYPLYLFTYIILKNTNINNLESSILYIQCKYLKSKYTVVEVAQNKWRDAYVFMLLIHKNLYTLG